MAQQEHGLSRRRACRLIGIARSVAAREPRRERDHARLRERLCALAGERRRFGYRRLHELLRREGFIANHKLVHRLYREEQLALRRRGRQKRTLSRPCCATAKPRRPSRVVPVRPVRRARIAAPPTRPAGA
jgi:putative transposase